jgi:hypothetical protein
MKATLENIRNLKARALVSLWAVGVFMKAVAFQGEAIESPAGNCLVPG